MKFQHYDYLIHYGVPGMKWGVRKDRKSGSSSNSGSLKKKESKLEETLSNRKKAAIAKKEARINVRKAKKEAKANAKIAVTSAKENIKANKKISKIESRKKISELSDAELKRRIDRLEMEKKYKNLKKEEVNAGAKIAANILKKSGENIGQQLVTYALGTAVNKVAKKNIVNPKKGQKDK